MPTLPACEVGHAMLEDPATQVLLDLVDDEARQSPGAVFYAILPYMPFDGALAGIYLIAHSVIRISLEYFRQDDRGRLWGTITHTNLYSAIMILAGGYALLHGYLFGARHVADMSVRFVHVLSNGITDALGGPGRPGVRVRLRGALQEGGVLDQQLG
jgi:Prolipoprotein diacylglyceryl transferase